MTETTAGIVNVADYLGRVARTQPEKVALALSKRAGDRLHYRRLTFRELDRTVDRLAHGLQRIGIGKGVRTALLVPPGEEFFALVFALWKVGAVVVLVDPGMGRKNVVHCLSEVAPEAFIGIPLAHVARLFFSKALPTVRINVTVGRRFFWRGHRYDDLLAKDEPFPASATAPEDLAAILFTTGSTGIPKGAEYRHGNFDAQVKAIREVYRIQPDEIDLCTFPLFALFGPALGMTAVVPDMDFTRPALVDPRNVIQAIEDWKVTHAFGSPALLDRVGRWGKDRGVVLPTLRRVISAGAPVAPPILERFQTLLPENAQVWTGYGATEALPVATLGSHEILADTSARTREGAGTCVGRRAGRIDVRIIKVTDEPIATWSDDLLVGKGEIGELCVRGPVVTRAYFARPEQTELAKIQDGDSFWHRMGDVGREDEQGRLWFCGRKSHRVVTEQGTLYTDPVEGIFNGWGPVRRSALVGVGKRPKQRPVVLVELEEGTKVDERALIDELRAHAKKHEVTRGIDTFLVHPQFPVDIRHNAKIFREKLVPWAAARV